MRHSILVRPFCARLLILVVFLLAGCGGAAGAATALATQAAATTAPSRPSAAPTASAASGTAAAVGAATASAPSAPATTTASAPSSPALTSAAPTRAGGPLAATAYPLTVTDDAGACVTLAAKPTHIVSLVPSSTEILYALGAGADLAAGTQYDDYPPAAKSKALIKGLKPSLEVVMAYHPDLVLASPSNAADLLQQLRTLHVPVVYLDPHDFAGVYHDIALVGRIVGAAAAAQRTVAAMQQQVQAVTAKITAATPRPVYSSNSTPPTPPRSSRSAPAPSTTRW